MASDHDDEFELRGPPREIEANAVTALDAALATAAGAPVDHVLHAHDPRRILRFSDGGPPVWSVGVCATPGDRPAFLFLTYGLSRLVDPDAPFGHELSIRVAVTAVDGAPPLWPTLLLRHLARYQRTGGRELAVGDPMTFADPITRAAVATEDQGKMPDSHMRVVAITADPDLARVDLGGNAAIEVRRVYGLDPAEMHLAEPWSCTGVMGLIASRDPTLTTDVHRRSYAADEAFVLAAAEGSAREGSETGAIVVPGIRWEQRDGVYIVHVPAGEGPRLRATARARLGFGRKLLVHDYDPAPRSEVGLEASDAPFAKTFGDRVLVTGLTADDPRLDLLETDDAIAWPAGPAAG